MSANRGKKKIRVLYLDDEVNNLRSFKAAFRRQYDIYLANDSEEAFEHIKTVSPQVIFSDQRMPITTGVEFFSAVRQVFPDPVRILITGYTDINDIIEAINKGHIYRYITKPWNENEVRVAIENAFDLYQTRRQLREKLEELEKANHELNRVIYSASHDLRAPLASSLGVIRVAKMEVEDELSRDYFNRIEESIEKLDIFVRNIINYYKNSKQQDEYTEIVFADLLEDVLESLKSHLGTDDAQIDLDIEQANKYIGDEFRIRIILSNLISNAIKFKKEDQEKARVAVTIRTDAENCYISVKDQGMGILDEHIHKVFNMFFKSSAEQSGSGIGLYIVKEALGKLGGSIEVKSRSGGGTEFDITIPNQDEGAI
jgi:signal transduction histidine kinase